MENASIKLNHTRRNSNNPRDITIGHKKEFLIDACHVFVLFNFAFAQPLYSLLSANAEFFVARHSKPLDIIALIIVASVAVPSIIVLMEWVVGFFGRHARKMLHVCIIGILVSIVLLPTLKNFDEISGRMLSVVAIFLGSIFTLAYIRYRYVRMFLTVLSFSVVIFPGLFLFKSAVFDVVFPDNDPPAIKIKINETPPIVMVVFDEFPVASLMNSDHEIDQKIFPNFSELAGNAYWYRNWDTVSEETLKAIPCLLSGSKPNKSKTLPSFIYYPHNLFTLLGGIYDLKVREPYTELCPKSLCFYKDSHDGFSARMKALLIDLSVVYLHIVLPHDLSRSLPIITQDWKMFWAEKLGQDALNSDRIKLFNEFIDSIVLDDKPALYFIHTVMPHIPWEYLPSGKKYIDRRGIPGLNVKKELWGKNEWLVAQGYQRHLLQVGFTDRLLGKIITKLKNLNMYDKSLLIFTADHGANFFAGRTRRGVLKSHPKGVLGIPFFIKLPYQQEGKIIDRESKSCDFLPTICDILNIDMPWPVQGKSVFPKSEISGRDANQNRKHFNRKIDDIVKHKTKIFERGQNADWAYHIGPHKSLIGRNIREMSVGPAQGTEVQFDQGLIFENVQLASKWSPSWITGDIYLKDAMGAKLNLAIAINGIIKGVTEAYGMSGKQGKFMAMVPENAFKNGKNSVEIFTISEAYGGVVLRNTEDLFKKKYLLRVNEQGGEEIFSVDDELIIPIVAKAVSAHLEAAKFGKDFGINEVGSENCIFGGWAADLENSKPAKAILLFVNGKFIFSGKPNMDRPGVMKYFNNPKLEKTGFDFMLPLRLLKNGANIHVRLFAISEEGVASEFFYPKGYMWAGK